MKLGFRDIEPFVKAPNPNAKIIVIYGPDDGLMRERSDIMAKTIVADVNDPFNVVDLTQDKINETPSLLSDEAFSMSMLGDKRLIIVRSAGNKLTDALKAIEREADKLDNVILVQAGPLDTKSSLRKFAEKSKIAVALPCYVEDEQTLGRFLQGFFTEQGYRIDRDALTLAAQVLHGDRALARNEANKITIFKGDNQSPITVKDITDCLGRGNLETLDMLTEHVASGDCRGVEKSLYLLFSEGSPSILILRSLKNYYKRLYITQAREKNLGLETALKKLFPPVFYKNKPAFLRHLHVWSFNRIQIALTMINEAEKSIKSGQLDDKLICNRTLLSLSKMVAR